MSARESIAYLRGLIDGHGPHEDPRANKFNEALICALDSIADELELLNDTCEEMRDYIEELEEALEEDDDECCEHGMPCGCGHHHHLEDEDIEEEYEAATCPHCGSDFFYEPNAYGDGGELLCPNCGEPFKH